MKHTRTFPRRGVALFLAGTYGISAPLAAWLEADRALLSERFDLPAWLVFVTCAVQFVCAAGVLRDRTAVASAALLTVTSAGAAAAHVRVGSPMSSLVGVVFSIVQLWFLIASLPEKEDDDRVLEGRRR